MHCSLKRSETGLSFRKPLPVLFFLSGIRDRVLGSKFKFGGRQGGGGSLTPPPPPTVQESWFSPPLIESLKGMTNTLFSPSFHTLCFSGYSSNIPPPLSFSQQSGDEDCRWGRSGRGRNFKRQKFFFRVGLTHPAPTAFSQGDNEWLLQRERTHVVAADPVISPPPSSPY